MKKGFNDYEKGILKKLFESRVWKSTHEIAKELEFSWKTVKWDLEGMLEDGFVLVKTIGDKRVWKFNYEKYLKLKKEI